MRGLLPCVDDALASLLVADVVPEEWRLATDIVPLLLDQVAPIGVHAVVYDDGHFLLGSVCWAC